MPSSIARWSTACTAEGSAGSPHTSLPGNRMAPKPRRRTVRSPSWIVSGPLAKRSIPYTMPHPCQRRTAFAPTHVVTDDFLTLRGREPPKGVAAADFAPARPEKTRALPPGELDREPPANLAPLVIGPDLTEL